MTDDIVTRLREHHCCDETDCRQAELAADEIERLRAERLEWFLVARQLRDAVGYVTEIQDAIDNYLRVRGRLEDPRD